MRVSIFDPMSLEQGTVFVFSNTNNILTSALKDDDLVIAPSKFACINLPMWSNTIGSAQTFYADPAQFGTASPILDPNILVSGLLQNYMDNLSLYATDKLDDMYQTFNESALWKMLQRTYSNLPTYDDQARCYSCQSAPEPFLS